MSKKSSKNGMSLRAGGRTFQSLADLTPDPANARKHNPRNVGMLVDSLHQVGAARSIVVDENGVVLAGNATIEAAAEAGIHKVKTVEADGSEIVAVVRRGLSKEQKTKLALYDNRVAELAEWNPDILSELVDTKALEGMFSDKELAEILTQTGIEPKDAEPQIDKAEELRQKWGTETGQLWVIGNHRLLVGDSTNKADVGRLMGSNRASAVVTDPPYGQAFLSNRYGPDHSAANPMGRLENDETPKPEMLSLWVDLLALKGAVYVCTRWAQCEAWRAWIAERLKVRNIIIWKKNNWSAGDLEGAFGFMYEQVVFASREGHKIRGARLPDVWEFNREAPDLHPTVKPMELMGRAIESSSDRGDVVADPFVGSGPTMVACENLGRECRAMDVEAKFAATTLERMTTAFPHLKIEKIDQARAA